MTLGMFSSQMQILDFFGVLQFKDIVYSVPREVGQLRYFHLTGDETKELKSQVVEQHQ